MTYRKDDIRARGDEYCRNLKTSISKVLGFGTQGMVFMTAENSAIKIHSLREGYIRERDIYFRLEERGIYSIKEFSIPRLLQVDDSLLVIEISIVDVPCILDFGGAYLDEQPAHVLRDDDWFAKMHEEFQENWDKAQEIIKELEFKADICLSDINTGNIKFPQAV